MNNKRSPKGRRKKKCLHSLDTSATLVDQSFCLKDEDNPDFAGCYVLTYETKCLKCGASCSFRVPDSKLKFSASPA